MEYCHCGSVAKFLKKGNRFTEDELRDIVSCALLGLKYLHNNSILHRVFE